MRSRCCVQILVSHEINSTQLYSNQWCIHPDKYRYKPVMIWCLDSALNFMETRWLSHHFGKMPTTEQAKKPAYMQKKSIHPSIRPSVHPSCPYFLEPSKQTHSKCTCCDDNQVHPDFTQPAAQFFPIGGTTSMRLGCLSCDLYTLKAWRQVT